MTYTIFGESHGPAIGVVLEGVPSGVEMDLDFIRSQGLNPQTMMIFTEGAALGVEVFPAESGGVDHRAVEVRRK